MLKIAVKVNENSDSRRNRPAIGNLGAGATGFSPSCKIQRRFVPVLFPKCLSPMPSEVDLVRPEIVFIRGENAAVRQGQDMPWSIPLDFRLLESYD
jgi:hypothetical protein